MTPQTPPTDRPLTAGDVPTMTVTLVRHQVSGTMCIRKWEGGDDFEPGTHVLGPLCLVHHLSRPATSAASEGEGVERILKAWCEGGLLQDYASVAEAILAALASPPVSEREREVQAWLIEHPTKRRRVVDAKQYDASGDDFWISPEAKAEHTVTALTARKEAPAEGAFDDLFDAADVVAGHTEDDSDAAIGRLFIRHRHALRAALRNRTSEPEAGAVAWVCQDGLDRLRAGKKAWAGLFPNRNSKTADVPLFTHPAPATADKLRVAVDALERIERGDTEVFDDDLECMVTVTLDAEEASDIARQALAALNEQPQ